MQAYSISLNEKKIFEKLLVKMQIKTKFFIYRKKYPLPFKFNVFFYLI